MSFFLLKIITKYIERDEVSAHLDDLQANMEYMVCIIVLYEDPIRSEEIVQIIDNNNTSSDNGTTARQAQDIAAAILLRHPTSECVSFDTYNTPIVIKMKPNSVYNLAAILNRRLGLMVGCGLGCIVFFFMVTILLYTKFRERKRIAKTDPAWSEMNEYKVHSKEDIINHSTTASTDNILLGMSRSRNYSLK